MGLVVIGAFFVLFILGFPVALAILVPSIVYVFLTDVPLEIIAQRMHYSLADSYTLIAVPVFIFVGNLMNSAGVTRRVFKFADTLVGRMPGGLAQVNIFASLIFSGMSGAALADVGGLGQIEIRAMKEKGFKSSFAGAITCASATVGPIFPPSIPLVIFGSVTGVSIVKLLVGGIVPAIVAVVMLMLVTGFISTARKYPRAERWPTFAEIVQSATPALPALVAPVLLVVGMLSGAFTPTEAASATFGYVVLITAFVYRELSWKHLIDSAIGTVKASASILLIVASAAVFGWILSIERIPQLFAAMLLSVSTDPIVLLAIVNLLLLVIGMFLDSTTATLLVIPILMSPMVAAGVNPVHFGLVAIFNLMIGLMTPPMGLSLFMISDVAKVSINAVLRELWPFFITLIVALIILTYIPALSLWIPALVSR